MVLHKSRVDDVLGMVYPHYWVATKFEASFLLHLEVIIEEKWQRVQLFEAHVVTYIKF
jgi:hypothetical protein